MAPAITTHRRTCALAATVLAAALLAPPAHALRLVDYNILNYPGTTGATRDPKFQTILGSLSPDIMVTEETNSQAGVTEFLNSVLNVLEPGQWAAAPFVDGNDTDCGFFYKPSKVQYLGEWSFYPNPANLLRLVHVYRVRPAGYSSEATDLRFYALHLKASTGFESQRLAECTGLRDSMNAMPPGTHAFALGDFNFYKASTEPGYSKLLESETNNIGRLYDPLFAADWHDSPGSATIHTQSPCLNGTGCASGASTGGMDDRFDFILPTLNLGDGQGLDLVPSSYVPVGNDGLHLNLAITDPPTIPEGAAYASALIGASDHLPIRVDIQLPAKISTVSPSLAFGTVIVGGPASQNLSISNPAPLPADALDYSFTAPAGFSAPGGAFTLAAGAAPVAHAITMSTASAGHPSGNLAIASDDPDHPSTLVALAGTVLDHAQASLDSTAALLADTLDFGDHASGEFADQLARVHNLGYNALQARLSLKGGVITGGDGRFSIVGGFSPALIAGTGQSYEVAFDDNDATADSAYFATLTFSGADEVLPGAATQPDLAATLRARRTGAVVAVNGDRSVPAATRLLAPFPNPLHGVSTLSFDLARPSHARLEVFDLHGRRVSLVANRAFEPGRYHFGWNGRDAGGSRLGTGLYFVRLSGSGLRPQVARLAILR